MVSAEHNEQFAVAVRTALQSLDIDDPLRGLIGEQYIDWLVSGDSRAANLAGLALLGMSDASARALGERVLEMSADQSLITDAPHVLDLLVLTVKEVELKACMDVFGLTGPPDLDLGEGCRLWTWTHDGLQIGLAVVGTDGNVESAIEVLRIFGQQRFRTAVMVGMAAGLEGSVRKGDVVVSTWVVAYEFARLAVRKYFPRAKAYAADIRSHQSIAQLLAGHPNWATECASQLRASKGFHGIERGDPERLTRSWKPRIKPGVVFAGSRLIEDGSLRELKEKINDKALAAEMEGAGFAAACAYLRVPWIVLRGIADYGTADVTVLRGKAQEGARGKGWQYAATFVAASFVRDHIFSARVPLVLPSSP